MHLRIAAACLAALLLLPTLAAARADVLAMPQLKGFELVQSIVRDDPAAGMQTRYRSRTHEELTADVFVYDGGEFADDEAAITSYLRTMREEMREAQRAGLYELVDFLEDGRRVYPSRGCGQTRAAWLRMRTTKQRQRASISHAHLFYAPPYTVKFRSTFPASGNRSFDDEIERFVGEFVQAWSGTPATACRRGLVAP